MTLVSDLSVSCRNHISVRKQKHNLGRRGQKMKGGKLIWRGWAKFWGGRRGKFAEGGDKFGVGVQNFQNLSLSVLSLPSRYVSVRSDKIAPPSRWHKPTQSDQPRTILARRCVLETFFEKNVTPQ